MRLKVYQDGFKLASVLEWRSGSFHEIDANVNLIV